MPTSTSISAVLLDFVCDDAQKQWRIQGGIGGTCRPPLNCIQDRDTLIERSL